MCGFSNFTLHQPVISVDKEELAIVILPRYGRTLILHLLKEWLIKLRELPVSIKAFNLTPFTLIFTVDFLRQCEAVADIVASVPADAVVFDTDFDLHTR